MENLSNTAVSGFGFDVPLVLPFPGSQSILAGDTYHFQLWYRDGMGVSNFSNGLNGQLLAEQTIIRTRSAREDSGLGGVAKALV